MSAGDEDAKRDEARLSGEELPVLQEEAGAEEAKWWHVADDQIQELVQKLAQPEDTDKPCDPSKRKNFSRSLSMHAQASMPKPMYRGNGGEGDASGVSAEARGKLTPQDALDDMLRRMSQDAPKKRPLPNAPEARQDHNDFDDGEDSMSRSSKWWHVSDGKIEDLIQGLRNENSERSSNSTAPVSPDSPTGRKTGHVRLSALGRADAIPCHITGRRHRAAPKGDDEITVYFHMVDFGVRFCLNVRPDLRIGPDQPPAPNRFTDKFGLGACTNGFELKAQNFNYKTRQWASNPSPGWVPLWTDSVKARIELTTGVEASRQRLFFNGSQIGQDATTVGIAGITNGVELQVLGKKDAARDQRDIVLACTAKRHAATLQNSFETKDARGEKRKHIMPPWKTQDIPNLFGGKDDGAGRSQSNLRPAVPSFENMQIYRSDIQESKLQRVRSLPCYTAQAARW